MYMVPRIQNELVCLRSNFAQRPVNGKGDEWVKLESWQGPDEANFCGLC